MLLPRSKMERANTFPIRKNNFPLLICINNLKCRVLQNVYLKNISLQKNGGPSEMRQIKNSYISCK